MSPDAADNIPILEGEAAAAVAHRGGHVQIIAAAGSGKTEVVSQRVASLLQDGASPESIVAFTFTEKAAEELKERIRERSIALLGLTCFSSNVAFRGCDQSTPGGAGRWLWT